MTPVPPAPGSLPLGKADVPRVLGIGFSFVPVLPADIYRPGLLDFVEITPEKLCRARRDGGFLTMDLVAEKLE
jgi:hypothetical protein